jgi:predicted nucleotidyltransferase
MTSAHPIPNTQYPLVDQLRDRLLARPEIAFAYLHGSFVEGLPYHDIDVAVYLNPAWTGDAFEYEMSLSTELTLALRVMVDIHALNSAPLGFCHAVLQGEVLFARDEEALADYIERVSLEYMDFEHLGRAYTREVALP